MCQDYGQHHDGMGDTLMYLGIAGIRKPDYHSKTSAGGWIRPKSLLAKKCGEIKSDRKHAKK